MSAAAVHLTAEDERQLHQMLVELMRLREDCACPIVVNIRHDYCWSAEARHERGCSKRLFRMHDLQRRT